MRRGTTIRSPARREPQRSTSEDYEVGRQPWRRKRARDPEWPSPTPLRRCRRGDEETAAPRMRAELSVIDTNVVVSGLLTSLAASPTVRTPVRDARRSISLSAFRRAAGPRHRVVLLRQKIRRRHGLSPKEVDVSGRRLPPMEYSLTWRRRPERSEGTITSGEFSPRCRVSSSRGRKASPGTRWARRGSWSPREYAEMVSG